MPYPEILETIIYDIFGGFANQTPCSTAASLASELEDDRATQCWSGEPILKYLVGIIIKQLSPLIFHNCVCLFII